jgi:hypothetical protein
MEYEVGKCYFTDPKYSFVRRIEAAWLFNLSPSVISEAITKGELIAIPETKQLSLPDVFDWRLKKVCPHLFKPMKRPRDINDYTYEPYPNDYRPRRRSAPKAAFVVKWWKCDLQRCSSHGNEFPMTPSAKPKFCPFCGNSSHLRRVEAV